MTTFLHYYELLNLIVVLILGLAIAADYEVGQKMIKDRSFEVYYFLSHLEILQDTKEILRRNLIQTR